MTTPSALPDADRIDPAGTGLTLSTGLAVTVVPLKTRQLFRLLRIITHGAGAAVLASQLDFGADPEDFAGRLLGIVMLAIPDAEQEAIEFVASMVEPTGLVSKPAAKLSKAEREANQVLVDQLNTDLFNPDLNDLFDIVETVVTHEAADLQALGGRLRRALELFRKTGQDKADAAQTPEPQPAQAAETVVELPDAPEMVVAGSSAPTSEPASPAPSPPPSMPSVLSMDGATSTYSTSHYAGSVKSVPLSPDGGPSASSPGGG